MASARLFIESEKLTQADDEFPKQLKMCAKDSMNIAINAEYDVLLISFLTPVILNRSLTVNIFHYVKIDIKST